MHGFCAFITSEICMLFIVIDNLICFLQLRKSKLPSTMSRVDISCRNINGELQELNLFHSSADENNNEADCYITSVTMSSENDRDCYITSVTMSSESQSSPMFSSPSVVCDDNDYEERNNIIQGIIGMLTSDIASNPEKAITWDLDDVDELLQELQSDTEPASSSSILREAAVSEPSMLPVDSSPIDSTQPPAVSRFGNADSYSNRSFMSLMHEGNETNRAVQNIIGMLMSAAGSCPVQATVSEKATADKATETSTTWDLDDNDVDDLLQDADPAHSCCVLLEAMSQLSTLPTYSSPIDSVQLHPVSVHCHCCHSGNCLQFLFRCSVLLCIFFTYIYEVQFLFTLPMFSSYRYLSWSL